MQTSEIIFFILETQGLHKNGQAIDQIISEDGAQNYAYLVVPLILTSVERALGGVSRN